MNLNAEDPLKIQVKLAEDPIKIQIHMPETPVIRVELGAGPQGPKGKKGDKGDDYVLTEEDKDKIAELTANKVDLSDYAKKTDTILNTSLSRGRNGSTGVNSIAFGQNVVAQGSNSVAVGNRVVAQGAYSHAEGGFTIANGQSAHAEGGYTTLIRIILTGATGSLSYSYTTKPSSFVPANGNIVVLSTDNGYVLKTITNVDIENKIVTLSATLDADNELNNKTCLLFISSATDYAHSEGLGTLAVSTCQHAQGIFNIPDFDAKYADIIGNGTKNSARSNAYALDWDGNGKYAGDVYTHSNPDSSGGDKLATEDYVDDAVSHISSMTIHICTAQEYDAQTGIPTIANPDATTFYLVPGGDAPNLYIEWIYTNNAWEQFGSASIDLSNYVQKTDYATSSNAGVVKISGAMGIDIINGFLTMATAGHAYVQDGTHERKAIPPKFQHESAFYGLAKAAGDTTQSQSSNPVGTYTDEAKAAIQNMLDVPSKSDIPEVPVGDVQVNGVSVVNEGIANVPCANANVLGVVQTEAEYGITIMAGTNGKLRVQQASATQVKAGQQAYKPIVPANQHTAVFYGLAAAAGDTTQSQSANAVGSYTDEAKVAVRTMFGLDDASILAIIENGLPAAEGVEW